MSEKCIDVSYAQGKKVDFNKLKKVGYKAVILHAGYGREKSQKDKTFDSNYKKAKKAGLKVGAYWYSYADSKADVTRELNACLSVIKKCKFDLPVFYDLEENSQIHFGKKNLTEFAKIFCDGIKKAGFNAGVYANLNWFKNYLDYNYLYKHYYIWLAQYYKVAQLKCDIWQKSDNQKIKGMNIVFDDDVLYNYTRFKPKSKKKSNTAIAHEVINGHWGNGITRKKKLQKAGYDYNAIQKIVNKLMGV